MSKSEITPEAIIAAGNACVGMGNAILGLAKLSLITEAQELAEQLKATAKSLRWLINENRDAYITPRSGNAPTPAAKEWLEKFLSDGPRKAAVILAAALDAGLDKIDIFRAREALGLSIASKQGGQSWSLPTQPTQSVDGL